MGLSSPDGDETDDGLSEIDWLRADVSFLLAEIDELEEEGPEGADVQQIIRSIINALQELATFGRRGEYREPDNVRAVADRLEAAAQHTLSVIPRKKGGRLQIPVVSVINHLQDFRDAVAECIAMPEADVPSAGS